MIGLTGNLSPNISNSAGWKCHPLTAKQRKRKRTGEKSRQKSKPRRKKERQRMKEKRVPSSMATFQVFQVDRSGHDQSTALTVLLLDLVALTLYWAGAPGLSHSSLVPLFQQSQPWKTVVPLPSGLSIAVCCHQMEHKWSSAASRVGAAQKGLIRCIVTTFAVWTASSSQPPIVL